MGYFDASKVSGLKAVRGAVININRLLVRLSGIEMQLNSIQRFGDIAAVFGSERKDRPGAHEYWNLFKWSEDVHRSADAQLIRPPVVPESVG